MLGAIYFNGFYPGHIGLPANTAYPVFCDGVEVMLQVSRHLRPIVVTDFNNDFRPRDDHPHNLVGLRRPIPQCPEGKPISVDLRAPGGGVEVGFLCTREHAYQLYRRRTFTEITVGVETDTFDAKLAPQGNVFSDALEHFLLFYEVVTKDVRVAPPSRLFRDVPMLRTARVKYGATPPKESARQERLIGHLPDRFGLETMSFGEFREDLPNVRHDPMDAARRIGHHLAVNTQLAPAQRALSDAARSVFLSRNPRFGVVEAASIAEFAAFDYLNSQRRADPNLERRAAKRQERGDLTFKVVINSFLPGLLDVESCPELIGELDRLRKKRNSVLHERAEASMEDAAAAMTTAQRLLIAIEASGGQSIAS